MMDAPLSVSYDCFLSEKPLWNDLRGFQGIFFFLQKELVKYNFRSSFSSNVFSETRVVLWSAISRKWKQMSCWLLGESVQLVGHSGPRNPPQTVSGHLNCSSFDNSLRSQHLPSIFRTHSLQHPLHSQNPSQIPPEGRYLRELWRCVWWWGQRPFIAAKGLSW